MARGKHSKKATPKSSAKATMQTATEVTPAIEVAVAALPAPVKTEEAAKTHAPALAASSVSRKVVVSREAIAQRAFELYRARGYRQGHAMADWLQAEAELSLGQQ